MHQSFCTRLRELASKRSKFCLGLDPTPQLLKQWGLTHDLQGLAKFLEIIIPLGEKLAIVKPQVAFYEQFGPQGLGLLQDAVRQIQQMGTLVLLDGKKGDITHTLTAYAQASVGNASAYHADAMTLTAYLGVGAMTNAFTHIADTKSAGFVVVQSSNPEGKIIQEAIAADGLTVAQTVAKGINDFNLSVVGRNEPGPIGAVVGATADPAVLEQLLPSLGAAWLLTPGLGKQGATYQDILTNFANFTSQVIPTSSREVLEQGPDLTALRDAIAREQESAALLS